MPIITTQRVVWKSWWKHVLNVQPRFQDKLGQIYYDELIRDKKKKFLVSLQTIWNVSPCMSSEHTSYSDAQGDTSTPPDVESAQVTLDQQQTRSK